MIDHAIAALADYGVRTGLIEPADRVWAVNRLLEVMGLSDYQEPAEPVREMALEDILRELLDDAAARGVIEDNITSRDLFDTKLMGVLTPRPSQVQARFHSLYAESPWMATEWYYRFSQDTDYIRRYRIAKDVKWGKILCDPVSSGGDAYGGGQQDALQLCPPYLRLRRRLEDGFFC